MKYRNVPRISYFPTLVDSFFDDFFTPTSSNSVMSNMDMYEEGNTIVVKLQAPGFSESDLEVSLDNRILTIEGKSSYEKNSNDQDKKYYFKEMRQQSFSRSVQLPGNIDEDSVKAEYQDGIVTITVTKKEESGKKLIGINR